MLYIISSISIFDLITCLFNVFVLYHIMLPIRARIQYKILLLVYKAFTNGSPTYLADMMTSCNPVRSTRSSHKVNLLVVPHQKSNKYSEKAFAVVGPRLWNELLTDELRGCNSVDTFKKKLKTMLFKKHY